MTAEPLPDLGPQRLRSRQKEQTREYILEAATLVFAEKGYADSTIDDITTAAGASRATLYAHFPGKEAVLAEIIKRMMSEVQVLYASFSGLDEWSRPTIRRWVTHFALAWQRDATRNKIATQAALPQLAQLRLPLQKQLIKHLRSRGELWGHFTPNEADARASMIVNLLQGEFPDFFFNNERGGEAEFIDYITDGLRDLLRADAAKS